MPMSKDSKSLTMPMIEHFGELRRRLVWVLVVFVLAMIGGFVVAKPIILYLQEVEPAKGLEWNVFSPWDTLRIYFQVAIAAALIVSLPFTLYHVWAFTKPGLKENEQKATLLYIPYAVLLYLAGLSFAYFVVFPLAFSFLTALTDSLNLIETYGIAQYFSFMFNILLPIGLLFELPVVVMFLTKLRVVNPIRLQKLRRYAYLALVVLGTLVTPPDAISAIIVSLPMILLYELSVIISRVIYRKQLQADEQREGKYTSSEISDRG